MRRGTLWRLVSHLSLSHLSLIAPDGNPEALREILRLYDYHDSAETRAMIDGVIGVFMVDDFVTVMKEADREWDALVPLITESLMGSFS